MSVLDIENTSRRLAMEMVESFKKLEGATRVVDFDSRGNLLGHFEDVYFHKGLYGFLIIRGEKSAIAYIGKSESNSRLRQHLTGKNTDGSQLAVSVGNKHEKLKEAIARGFSVHLCTYSNPDFGKPSISCLEIAAAIYSKSDCAATFPGFKHWNERIG